MVIIFKHVSFYCRCYVFVKKHLLFLKGVNFLVALLSFGKKEHFVQKALIFGQMGEFLSTMI